MIDQLLLGPYNHSLEAGETSQERSRSGYMDQELIDPSEEEIEAQTEEKIEKNNYS
jgi:hypothetical protein